MKSPQDIVEMMLKNDAFSHWLDVKLISINKGECTLEMTVQQEMLNGFSIGHGGITYSLADSALAFASNSYGHKCVSIETSISHTKPIFLNDTLKAIATELNRGRRIGVYQVVITNQNQQTVALFKGTVHISEDVW